MNLPLRNVKVAPSKVSSGVGLFPIDKIPKNSIVFTDDMEENFKSNSFKLHYYSPNKQKYFSAIWGGDEIPSEPYFHPVCFLNHSYNPTVYFDRETRNYLALKNLLPSDEITINYVNYNDQALNKFKHKIKKPLTRKSKRKPKRKSKRKSKRKF